MCVYFFNCQIVRVKEKDCTMEDIFISSDMCIEGDAWDDIEDDLIVLGASYWYLNAKQDGRKNRVSRSRVYQPRTIISKISHSDSSESEDDTTEDEAHGNSEDYSRVFYLLLLH